MSKARSSASPSAAAASSPSPGPPPRSLKSWATSGRPRSSAASAPMSATSPASRRSPSVAAQRPPRDRDRGLALGEVGDAPLLGLDLELLRHRATGDHLVELVLEPGDHGAQLELVRELAQAGAVLRARHHLRQVELALDVVLRRGELLRDAGVVGVLGQVLLALRAADLVDRIEHLLERAEALEQVGGGLVADPGDAGDVVRGVALQPDQVGDELGRDPVALDHAVAVVDLRVGDPAGGRHHPHPVADQLVDVAVAGDDHHRDLRLARAPGQGRDQVVGLEALGLDVGEAEGLDGRRQVRPLLAQQVGPRLALRLVRLVGDLAPGPAGVPGDDHRRRIVLGDDLRQHRGEPVDRVRRPPVGGRHVLGQGEERPVGEAVAVDQEELGLGALGLLLGLRGGHAPIIGAGSAPPGRAPALPRPRDR